MTLKTLFIASAIAFGTPVLMAANITCQPDKSGAMVATKAWKNTLGAEADRMCADEQQRIAQQAAAVAAQKSPPPQPVPTGAAQPVPTFTPTSQPGTPPPSAVELQGWNAMKTDRTMSAVLVRWARQAGWTYSADDWVAPKDLPIVTNSVGVFSPDFKSAVRELTSTSELTDMSIQPCFYSNKVLRIIKVSDSCFRGASEQLTSN